MELFFETCKIPGVRFFFDFYLFQDVISNLSNNRELCISANPSDLPDFVAKMLPDALDSVLYLANRLQKKITLMAEVCKQYFCARNILSGELRSIDD